jgi:hypothetical protein
MLEPSVFGSRHCTRNHFHNKLELSCLSPACWSLDNATGPTFTPPRLGLSRLRVACLGPGSAFEHIFTFHGLGLSHTSSTCLGPGCTPESTFTSHGLGLSCPSLACLSSGTLPEPNTRHKIFLGPHTGPSVFYTNPIHIILSKIQFKISQGKNYTSDHFLHQITRLMSYKYIIRPSE